MQRLSLAECYQRINYVTLPFLLFGMFVAWILLGLTFYLFYVWRLASLPPSEFVFSSTDSIGVILVTAFGLGICLTGLVCAAAQKVLMGRQQYLEYIHWEQARSGWSSRGMARVMLLGSLPFCLVGLIGFPLTMNSYERADDKGIAYSGMGSFEETFHHYESVRGVTLFGSRIKEGKRSEARKVVVAFDDGSEWTPNDLPWRDVPRFVAFLEGKTGKQAERVGFLDGKK